MTKDKVTPDNIKKKIKKLIKKAEELGGSPDSAFALLVGSIHTMNPDVGDIIMGAILKGTSDALHKKPKLVKE